MFLHSISTSSNPAFFTTVGICVILFLMENTAVALNSKLSGPEFKWPDDEFIYGKFPDDFLWGFGTCAHQIEGAWNIDNKGPNIWDTFTHMSPSPIADGSNADIACDSYYRYKEDVQLLKNTGANFYRFSISWSRLLPDGTISFINPFAIDYYNRLIDELEANGIIPMICMYVWDIPQALEDNGGWINETIIDNFGNFSRVAYQSFGHRVKYWFTFNEPGTFCTLGYGDGFHAPGINEPGVFPYICAHNVLKAHALSYAIYKNEFKESQGGEVGIILNTDWNEPGTNKTEDIEAAERALQFWLGWFANPLFYGEYPQVMREYVDARSLAEGRNESRLPHFDPGWSFLIQGSFDFLGINAYTTALTLASIGPDWSESIIDSNVTTYFDESWEGTASSWLKVVPWGFRKVLNWIKNTYGNPKIFITESGMSDNGTIGTADSRRVNYYNWYINNMLQAILLDGVNIMGYTAWALIDNFEWAMGYSERFGVHYIDFNDPNRTRIPKESAIFLTELFRENGFSEPK